jgi:DNA-repair protein XRCC1
LFLCRCAFKNTPKYRQVQGKGKIISKDWIEKCHSLKKRLSWRKFALDSTECEKSDSEDEIFDLSLKPSPNDKSLTTNNEKPKTSHEEKQDKSHDATLAQYDLEDFNPEEKKEKQPVEVDESDDTDDEIERVRQRQKNSRLVLDTMNILLSFIYLSFQLKQTSG